MASEPDDNPFARNSAWPKMPQAPFRVGPLPKVGVAPAHRSPEPAPTTVTPVFVRPVEASPLMGLASGGGVPQAQPRPAPVAPPEPEGTGLPPQHRFAELAPLVVEARRKVQAPPAPPEPPAAEPAPAAFAAAPPARPKARRRSSAPVWAAAFVGVAGLAGLAYMFTRGQAAAPPAVASPPTAVVSTPAPVTAPAPQPVETPDATPARVAAAPRAPVRVAKPRLITPPPPAASAATEEAITAPVIALPPAPVAPEPDPAPAFTPRPAPDPNEAITTRRPY